LPQRFRHPVAERGLRRSQAGGVQFQSRPGEPGERLQLVRVVPDQPEIRADLVHQTGRGGATMAVLERRQIGRRDLQGGREVPLQGAAGGAQAPEFFTEGRHGVR